MKSKYLISFSVILLTLFMSACQSITHLYSRSVDDKQQLYRDDVFPNAHNFVVETQDHIFAIDQEMKDMVRYVLKPKSDDADKAKLLLEYIFSSNHIDMSYDTNANVTAIDAFHGKKANCMSLTIMAYALGREAGMSLRFQDIKVPEYWVRSGTHQLLMGHVNLLITRKPNSSGSHVWSKEILQIDFDPSAIKKHFPRKVVSKNAVTAMFYNNKGAEAMVQKKYDEAYAYLKAATNIDPKFSSAWGNLGILYRLNGLHEEAINAYQYTLSLSPNDYTALENLSILYEKMGNVEEYNKISDLLHNRRIENPYYHALLSDEAMFKGDMEDAIKHLKKAIKLDSKFHEFYYTLSKLYYQNNQIQLAQSAIKKALKLNKNFKTEVRYNRKLSFLNQASVRH